MKLPKPPGAYRRFAKRYPKSAEHYEAFSAATISEGPLDERCARLVKLAVAVGARSEGAVHSAVRKGLAAGLQPQEVLQVAMLAMPTIGLPNGVATMTWIETALAESGKT
jgi:alkylhydroperoxidase/carboxymuconolactone decarboxylase family protein YurZ